jgi:hypothetical protein
MRDTVVVAFYESGCKDVNWDVFIFVFELASFVFSGVRIPEIWLVYEQISFLFLLIV